MAVIPKNFAYSTIATAPSPATTGTSVVVAPGDGAKFTIGANAVLWPAGVDPTAANAEIVGITGVATDTLTIVRSQEGTTAQTVAVGWQIDQGTTNALLAELTDLNSAQTLTNKRITKRVLGLSANSATPAINTDSYDVVHITAQTATITGFTMSGTPVDGDTLRVSITGTAAVAITWGTSFEASTVALPTTTVTTARLDVGFFWNTETSKWRCMAVA